MGQEQVQRQPQEQTPVNELAAVDAETQAVRREEIRAGAAETISNLDELLDEIDEVLEVEAEDFVKSYVQKGGE